MIPIGKRLMPSPAFPPVHTVHATFTAHGVPSSLRPTGVHHSAFHYRRHRRCEHRFSVFIRPLICFAGLCSLNLEERIHRIEHHFPCAVRIRNFQELIAVCRGVFPLSAVMLRACLERRLTAKIRYRSVMLLALAFDKNLPTVCFGIEIKPLTWIHSSIIKEH